MKTHRITQKQRGVHSGPLSSYKHVFEGITCTCIPSSNAFESNRGSFLCFRITKAELCSPGETLNASKEGGFNKNDVIKIPFPEEAQEMKNTLIKVGLQSQVNKFEYLLNEAAEDASNFADQQHLKNSNV